jgi:hypothetical protein
MPVNPVEICNTSGKDIVFELSSGLKITLHPKKCETFKKKCETEDVTKYLKEHECEKKETDSHTYNTTDCKK